MATQEGVTQQQSPKEETVSSGLKQRNHLDNCALEAVGSEVAVYEQLDRHEAAVG